MSKIGECGTTKVSVTVNPSGAGITFTGLRWAAPDRVKARIVARSKPCSCGCKGRDPWHARHFDRTILDARVLYVEEAEVVEGVVRRTFLEGVACSPWGDERVVEVGIATETTAALGRFTKWWKIADR